MNMQDIKGQAHAKRALEVAAAGYHSVLMLGPASVGKTMLADSFWRLLPTTGCRLQSTMTPKQIRGKIQDRRNCGDSGVQIDDVSELRPASMRALLDTIADRDLLILTMRMCPCGNFGTKTRECTCSVSRIKRHLSKAKPLVGHIDIMVELSELRYVEMLNDAPDGESSDQIYRRVIKAKDVQSDRFVDVDTEHNAFMTAEQIRKFCNVSDDGREILKAAIRSLYLNMRDYNKTLCIARTIADLDCCEDIKAQHIAEAIQYRTLDIFRGM